MGKSFEGNWLHKQFSLAGYAKVSVDSPSWDSRVWAELQGFLMIKVFVQRANLQVALSEGLKAAKVSMRYLRGLNGIRCTQCILEARYVQRTEVVTSWGLLQQALRSIDHPPTTHLMKDQEAGAVQ